MKKQLFGTMAILSLTLFSCKKEDKTFKNDELNAPPPIPTAKREPIYITIPAAVVHSTVWVKFGWEYSANDNGGPLMVINIKSSQSPGGGVWIETEQLWTNVAGNPNLITIKLFGTYTYLAGGSFGADKVRQEIIINLTYDIKTKVRTVTVKSTGADIVKK